MTSPNTYAREAETLESLSVLLRAIAHDMNNLLMGVVGTAGLLVSDFAEGSKERKRIDLIRNSAQQARELNSQLVTFSANKACSADKPIELNPLIEEIRLLLRVVLFKKATLRTYLEPRLPAIIGDPQKIQTTVMSLLARNPDTLNKGEGTVTIKTGEIQADAAYLEHALSGKKLTPGNFVYLEVSDSRIQLEPQKWAELAALPSALENSFDRSGLMRALILVRCHHGALEVLPLGDQGVSFRLLFPGAA